MTRLKDIYYNFVMFSIGMVAPALIVIVTIVIFLLMTPPLLLALRWYFSLWGIYLE